MLGKTTFPTMLWDKDAWWTALSRNGWKKEEPWRKKKKKRFFSGRVVDAGCVSRLLIQENGMVEVEQRSIPVLRPS